MIRLRRNISPCRDIFMLAFTTETEAGRDKNYSRLLGLIDYHTKSPAKTDHHRMCTDVNFIPTRRAIPPVSVFQEKIIPARRDIPPVSVYMEKIIPARRDGIKIPYKRKVKVVCVSMGSWGIPAMRNIPARRAHVNRPLLVLDLSLKKKF